MQPLRASKHLACMVSVGHHRSLTSHVLQFRCYNWTSYIKESGTESHPVTSALSRPHSAHTDSQPTCASPLAVLSAPSCSTRAPSDLLKAKYMALSSWLSTLSAQYAIATHALVRSRGQPESLVSSPPRSKLSACMAGRGLPIPATSQLPIRPLYVVLKKGARRGLYHDASRSSEKQQEHRQLTKAPVLPARQHLVTNLCVVQGFPYYIFELSPVTTLSFT